MNRLPAWTAVAVLCAPLAVRAAQPLVSDDTGVQGEGRWQAELGFERTARQARLASQRAWSATLTYGLADELDLYAGVPYADGGDAGSGWGDAELGVKWSFASDGPFSFALKPVVTLPSGDERRGLGTGRAGLGATLIAQWESERLTLLGNAGFFHQPNAQGERQSLWRISGAALYRVGGSLQLALDAVVSRNPDPGEGHAPAYLIAGAIYSPRPWLDLALGYRRGLDGQAGADAAMAGLTVRW
jgi:hypothetical protein